MKEEWLFPNAVVPVDVETTAALVAEIHRLIDVVGGLVLKQALAAPDCKETGVCIQTGLACFGQSAQPAPVQATMKLESSGPGYGPAPKQKLSVRHVSLIDEGKTSAQPAPVQENAMIYKTFEQWKSGNVLEHGVPRTEHYSEDQFDLVEMGWNYGYDAGRAVEQALDKKAENARELGLDYEPVWDNLPSNKDVEDAMQMKRLNQLATPPAAQRQWVGLTHEEIEKACVPLGAAMLSFTEVARAIEAKLKEKNT
jgi:hypothetical protein